MSTYVYEEEDQDQDEQETSTSLVVVERQDVFDQETEVLPAHKEQLTDWLNQAMAIFAVDEHNRYLLSPERQIEEVQAQALALNAHLKECLLALGFLLTYARESVYTDDRGKKYFLFNLAGQSSFDTWCSTTLGITNATKGLALDQFKVFKQLEPLGFTIEECTDETMTPVTIREIIGEVGDVERQLLQLPTKTAADKARFNQERDTKRDELIKKVNYLRSIPDEDILDAKNRELGVPEKIPVAMTDITVRHGKLQMIVDVPATEAAAERLAKALGGTCNVICQMSGSHERFPLSDLTRKLFVENNHPRRPKEEF